MSRGNLLIFFLDVTLLSPETIFEIATVIDPLRKMQNSDIDAHLFFNQKRSKAWFQKVSDSIVE